MQILIHNLAVYFQQHISSIAIGIVATFLVVFGQKINRFFKKQTRSMNFLVRYFLFVLLCTVGYGFLSSQSVKLLRWFLNGQSDFILVTSVIGFFFILGFFAKQGREI
jgi:hypothetical protein